MSKQSSSGAAWDRLRRACLDRDGWVCAYCGKALEGADATADHIVAKANGGTDDLDNLISACRRCNGRKSDQPEMRVTWFNPAWLDRLP